MPDLDIEQAIWNQTGLTYLAGIDEAGRGAIAGPVVAAAVVLPLDRPELLAALWEVDDSKRLPAATRVRLFPLIADSALSYGVGVVPAETIDQMGIMAATRQAMTMAVRDLVPPAQYLLIDGRIRLPNISLPQQSIIRGDGKSLSIAAASILAKVTRDRLMVDLGRHYPLYDFDHHKGYGTPRHLAAVAEHGPTPIHRSSFAPLRRQLI